MPLSLEDAELLARSVWFDWNFEREHFDLYDRYYNGDHPMPLNPPRLTQAYQELMAMSVSNWCRLVVDVVAERLEVQAVVSSSDKEQDATAWGWWQDNNLDFNSNNVHVASLKHGVSYVAVGKPLPGKRSPRIMGQVGTQCQVRFDPEDPDRAIAAIKVWQGRDGFTYVTLYDDECMYRFVSPGRTRDTSGATQYDPRVLPVWQQELIPRTDDGGWCLPHGMDEVPFVRFPCQPDLLGGYASELSGILTIQDRINKTTFHRLLAQEFTAFPQRWVTGIDIPIDPTTGQPVEPFEAAVDRLWAATSEQTQFGQFPAGDPQGYISSLQQDIQALATQSRTPPHYLTGGMGQFPSGESVRATEYGLTQKVRDRRIAYTEAWGDVLRLAAKAAGNTDLQNDPALTVVWEDVEARTEGEIVDALLKMSTLGVPLRALWQRWGATPDEVEQWDAAHKQAQAEAAKAAALIGQAPPSGPITGSVNPPTPVAPPPGSQTLLPDKGDAGGQTLPQAARSQAF